MISAEATAYADQSTTEWRPAQSLSIAVDHSPAAATVIMLDGELDSSTTVQLGEALSNAIRPGASVILDLNGLRFMGSAGLAVLLAATEQAGQTGATLRLILAPDNLVVGRPLMLTGLASVLSIVPDLPSALR